MRTDSSTGTYTSAASDGAGNAYFAGSKGDSSTEARLVKYEEATYSIVWQKSYGHSTFSGYIAANLNFHASATDVAFMI